jgi:hypothetical protein
MRLRKKGEGGISNTFHTPMQVDKDGVITNGKTNLPYLPSDPERRRNLLNALGIVESDLLTLEDCR